MSLRLESICYSDSLYKRFSSTVSLMQQFLSVGSGKSVTINRAFEKYKFMLKEVVLHVFANLNQGHIISTTKYFLINVAKVKYIRNFFHKIYLYFRILRIFIYVHVTFFIYFPICFYALLLQ